ncbi:MAG: Hit-like protein involved in cell-cycle regulation [Anaerolineaceae bacterium]|nr:MAG: Hit-like protein involved in cell-cycle regulation [Anaerolineaceae bacterium]
MNNLYRFLRRPFFYRIFTWMLNAIPFAIPVKRLRETDSLLAFFHPKPDYPFHVILIPKKAVRSLPDLDPASPFLADLVAAAQSLVAEYRLPAYRLIVNGGEYQEFPHLHFHLVSDSLDTEH